MKTFGDFDYVIVGGGSAGCVLANRLSANPGTSVLLLEAGGEDDYIWVKIPVGYLYCIGNSRTDWGFRTEPESGLNGRSIGYPRGRILGGCSAINGMIYMRGQAADYDSWRQLGNIGWGWDDVLPYFLKSEDHFQVDDPLHGQGGEMRIERQRLSWEILDRFRDAMEQAGIPKVDDFNRGNNEGSSYFHVNQKRGWRWSMATGFLKPARRRSNLHIVTGAHVSGLTIEGGRVTGVRFFKGGEQFSAPANAEVILSAGAIGSPHIMMLSGMGDPARLADKGIDCILENKSIGANLQDHLQLRLIYRIRGAQTLNQRAATLMGKTSIALEYVFKRSGPMSMSPSQLGAFVKSDPALETPDLQYHIQPLSLDRFGEPLHDFPAITASVCNLRPQSRGHVGLRSSDWRDAPVIAPNYLSQQADRLTAAKSIRITRNVLAQRAMAQFAPEEYLPGPAFDSDDELVKAAGNIGTTIFHPVGTARMGQDEDAVVDHRLKVRGIDGLRVVDASIMPVITSGNTNAPTVMIAEKASAMILAGQ